MHEMSIIEALLDTVRRELRAHPGACVQTITVRVGALRKVVPDIMKFCFEAATRDTEFAGSSLELEQIPARALCSQCRKEFPVTENWFECPHCKTISNEVLTGQELDLTGIEFQEACVG